MSDRTAASSNAQDAGARQAPAPDIEQRIVDTRELLQESLRRGVKTIDLGDVAPGKPVNMNPFESAKPADGGGAEPIQGHPSGSGDGGE